MKMLHRLALLCLVTSLPASAADRLVQVRPGAEGEDVAAYGFIPSLARGGADTLYAFSATDNGADHSMQTFVKFPVGAGFLGANERVKYAELRMAHSFDFGEFGNVNDEPGNLSCHVVTQPWSEATVTWSNKPTFGPVIQTISNITSLGVLSFVVTDVVQGWATGALANDGFALTSTSERVLGFYSFERTDVDRDLRPHLLAIVGASDFSDADADGVADAQDDCPAVANARQEDQDGDGVGDACDRCIGTPDPDQRDTDGDGYGNACDPDLNGDRIVNFVDLAILKRRFFSTDPDADFNGDDVVNFQDLSRLKQWMFGSPGPSAAAP